MESVDSTKLPNGGPYVKPCDDCYKGKCERHVCEQCGRPLHGFYTYTPLHDSDIRLIEKPISPEEPKQKLDDTPDDELWHAIHDNLLVPAGVVEAGHYTEPPHQCCVTADDIYRAVKAVREPSSLPLSVADSKKVCDWITQHCEVADGDENEAYYALSDIVQCLDHVGDDSLWFSGKEWQEMMDKGTKWDMMRCQYVYCAPGHEKCLASRWDHEQDPERYGHKFRDHDDEQKPCVHALGAAENKHNARPRSE